MSDLPSCSPEPSPKKRERRRDQFVGGRLGCNKSVLFRDNYLATWWSGLRDYLRFLNGDTAYARYLAHWQQAHAGAGTPLSRANFFNQETDRRWSSVRRCC